jgi:YD repeat-containing protein
LSVTAYNGNGSLINYEIGNTAYTLAYDAENRLSSVTVGSQTTRFFYDADGQRVRTLYPNGTNVYTPFPEYEETVSGSTVTKRSNYYLNGQLTAFRVVTGSAVAHYFTFADRLDKIISGVVAGKRDLFPAGETTGKSETRAAASGMKRSGPVNGYEWLMVN